jgi:hypothetical protein
VVGERRLQGRFGDVVHAIQQRLATHAPVHLDHLPDVETGPDNPRAPSRASALETDPGMLARPHGLLYQLVEQLALVAPLRLRKLDGVPVDRAADLRFGPASLHSPFFTNPSPEDTITPPYLLRWHFKKALS